MCLTIDRKNGSYRPNAVSKRTFVYKVVAKYIGQDESELKNPYHNVFELASQTNYILNQVMESNRSFIAEASLPACPVDLRPCEIKNYEVYKGFHAATSISIARKLKNSIKTHGYFRWNLVCRDANDWDFVILKCKVDKKDHIADGLFDINDDDYGPAIYVKSVVYHKITPIEEVE